MGISKKQKQIMAFPYTNYDALICDGAIRSGKTSFMMLSFVDDAMRRYSNQHFGICGKTVDSAIKNIINPYLGLVHAREKYRMHWRRSDKLLVVTDGLKQNVFEVFGGKDESSFTLIQGRTLAGVLIDEVALQPRSFVEQAIARCSVAGSKFWFNCNPDSPAHWFYQEWVLKAKERNALHLHFLLEDNPGLAPEIVARYKSSYTGAFYQRYILGEWVLAEGLIYQIFADETDKYLIADPLQWRDEHNTRYNISFGVDFGGSGSATKFQATGITPTGIVVAIDEEYIDHRKEKIDPDTLNKRFAAFVRRVSDKYGSGQTRADSAEQILIRGLSHTAQKEGLKTQVKNALKLPINDRIKLVLLLMAQGRFFVSKDCPRLIDALRSAIYDPAKYEDIRLDDGTTDIDSLDAFEYSIEPFYKQLEAAGFRR